MITDTQQLTTTKCTLFGDKIDISCSTHYLCSSNSFLFLLISNSISFFTSLSVTGTFAHWLNMPSNCELSLLAIFMSLCASSNRCGAPAVCLMRTTLLILRREALRVFWQTILMGVNAAVMLPLPSC